MLTSSLLAQEHPLSLRISWQPGKTYTIESSTDTTASKPGTPTAGGMMRVQQTSKLAAREDKDTHHKLVDVLFAHVRGEQSGGGRTATFDSATNGDRDPILSETLGTAVGKTFTLEYDAKDRFRDVRGLESLATKPAGQPSLRSIADSKNVAILYRKSLEMGLPPVPVSVGDTWTADETIQFPSAGEVRVQMNGKLESIEPRNGHQHAKVTFEGKLGNTAPRTNKPLTATEINSDSSMAGILLYDLEEKVVTYAAYTTSVRMTTPGGLVVFDQKISSKVTNIETVKQP
jgi:hypothetical protein